MGVTTAPIAAIWIFFAAGADAGTKMRQASPSAAAKVAAEAPALPDESPITEVTPDCFR